MTTQLECQTLAEKHHATLLLEIYQSDAGRLGGAVATTNFDRTLNGVCAALAAEWIRLSLVDERKGEEMKLFREMVQSGWRLHVHFMNRQQEMSSEIARIQNLSNEADELIAKASSSREIHSDPSALRKIFYAKSIPTVSEVNAKIRAANVATQAFNNAKQAYLDSLSGFLSKAKVLTEKKPIAELAVNFGSLFSKKGYYYLSITPKGSSDGHALAVHTVGLPRLLDANTCEWQFSTMADLSRCWAEYFQKFYLKDYAGGTFSITHFDDTFYEKMQFSDPWYWRTPLPRIEDLEPL